MRRSFVGVGVVVVAVAGLRGGEMEMGRGKERGKRKMGDGRYIGI
jgi:hypothetical protein